MSAIAIVMLLISIILVWGGLALALVNLARHPEDDDEMPEAIAPEL